MNQWDWNGARWWKFDFHTHTPASDDYGKGPNQAVLKNRTPREWLLDCMHAGVDCVAITDHNTGLWIDELKSALQDLEKEMSDGFRKLYLFPGVEISVNGGVHLLAILGCDKTTSDIDSLLGAAGFSGTKGSGNAVTTKSFGEVAAAIQGAGGIAIPAHVDGDNGLFGVMGTTLKQHLDCEQIFSMEVVNPSTTKPQVYSDKRCRWTEVLGSDAHHPVGKSGQRHPGSHFTWVKMGSPSLEGLRLALLDGVLSVRRSDQGTGDPNEHAPLILESVEISQARYMGRAQSFTVGFNPWLNAVVGGRGTGKSTIVEFLRLALRRTDELPEALKPEFEKYGMPYSNREDGGLLTEKATIQAIYRKNGSRFRIQWGPEKDLNPIECEDDGGWKRAEGDVQHRFPVRIYSQKQVFELAKTPLALLGIVDEAPEVDRRSWNDHWREEEVKFLSLRAKSREIEAGLAEEPRLRGELDDIKRKLSIFENAGHADVLMVFQKRSRQKRTVERWEEEWRSAADQLREVAAGIVPDPLDDTAFDITSKEDAQFHTSASGVRNNFMSIQKTLNELAAQAEKVFTDWRKTTDDSVWKKAVDAAVTTYESLQQKLKVEGAGDPAAYGELVQRRQVIEQRLKELDDRKKQIAELKKQAEAASQRLLEIRRELSVYRRLFLENVLKENRYVRIHVLPYGARQTIEPELRKLLQREGGGFEKDIGQPGGEGLLGGLYNNDEVSGTSAQQKGEAIEQNLAKIKSIIGRIYQNHHDSVTIKDQRFVKHIQSLPPEALDRIEIWFPEDSLDVQYGTTGDGQRFRSIQEGSPGQKTAALLAFLLSYGNEPLLLDQPEDDLDNRLIYDLIVTQLREVKQHRQVVVVTHNANIVVNGDAELVVALTARGGETQKECEGSLQEKKVRETICAIMEGGREAFEQRYRRIALEGRYV